MSKNEIVRNIKYYISANSGEQLQMIKVLLDLK